jgi:hypothetical protein
MLTRGHFDDRDAQKRNLRAARAMGRRSSTVASLDILQVKTRLVPPPLPVHAGVAQPTPDKRFNRKKLTDLMPANQSASLLIAVRNQLEPPCVTVAGMRPPEDQQRSPASVVESLETPWQQRKPPWRRPDTSPGAPRTPSSDARPRSPATTRSRPSTHHLSFPPGTFHRKKSSWNGIALPERADSPALPSHRQFELGIFPMDLPPDRLHNQLNQLSPPRSPQHRPPRAAPPQAGSQGALLVQRFEQAPRAGEAQGRHAARASGRPDGRRNSSFTRSFRGPFAD